MIQFSIRFADREVFPSDVVITRDRKLYVDKLPVRFEFCRGFSLPFVLHCHGVQLFAGEFVSAEGKFGEVSSFQKLKGGFKTGVQRKIAGAFSRLSNIM